MAVEHRYQIGILGDPGDLERRLRRTVLRRLSDLGIPSSHVRFFAEKHLSRRDRKAPFVGVFFGYRGVLESDHPWLKGLLDDSQVIFPVVKNLTKFSSYVPGNLHGIQGMQIDKSDRRLEGLCSSIFESLRLLRSTRRLFISYKRNESQNIAIQAYETLDSRGFDVFLDTHSVRPGEPFQDVLWHRLADTDVVLLLDTPGFLRSRWTQAELARANTTNLQVLQVLWPSTTIAADAAFSKFFVLSRADFVGAKMTGTSCRLGSASLDKIAVEVESLRARALAARHTYLVDEFCNRARALGLKPALQNSRLLEVPVRSSEIISIIPAIGVPDARLFQDVEAELRKRGRALDQVWLIYDERGIRDMWLDHLQWLNDYVPVKSVRVTNCDEPLRKFVS